MNSPYDFAMNSPTRYFDFATGYMISLMIPAAKYFEFMNEFSLQIYDFAMNSPAGYFDFATGYIWFR